MRSLEHRFPVYSRIIKLYPPAYRRQYGQQMLQTFADMLDNESSSRRRLAMRLRLIGDVPISLTNQQVRYASHSFLAETPTYVQRNTAISFAMFLPFLLIVLANDLTAHGFYHTWLWSFGVLLTWIIVMPALGLLISLVTFFTWLVDNRKQSHKSWKGALFDFSHNWPMLALSGFGAAVLLMVFFHDSVHCVLGYPVGSLHIRQAWQCIQTNSFL